MLFGHNFSICKNVWCKICLTIVSYSTTDINLAFVEAWGAWKLHDPGRSKVDKLWSFCTVVSLLYYCWCYNLLHHFTSLFPILNSLLLLLYLTFMAFLTTSLVLAARSSDPNNYSRGIDRFRLFCEIVTLLWVMVNLVIDIASEISDVHYTQ